MIDALFRFLFLFMFCDVINASVFSSSALRLEVLDGEFCFRLAGDLVPIPA